MENKERTLISTIQNHRESMGTEELWGAISPHIPQQKKPKRRAFLWFFFAGMALILLSGVWLIDGEKDVLLSDEVMAAVQKENVAINTGKSNEKVKEKITSNTDFITPEITEIDNKNIPNSDLVNDTYSSMSKDLNNASFSNQNFERKASNIVIENTSALRENKGQENMVLSSTYASQNSDFSSSFSSENSKSVEPVLDVIAPLIEPEKTRNLEMNFAEIDSRFLQNITAQNQYVKLEKDIAIVEMPIRQNSQNWMLFFTAGAGASYLKVSAVESEFDYQAVNIRQASNPTVEFSADFGIGCKLGRYVMLSSGLNYSKGYDAVSFVSNSEFTESTEDVLSITTYQDGSSFVETGEISNVFERESTVNGYNSWSQISIPFRARFYAYNLNGMKFFVEPMIAYSVSQNQSGYLNFDSNEVPYSLDDDVLNKYRKYGNINTGISLGAEWQISEKNAFLFNTTLHNRGNIFNGNLPLKKSYRILRFSFGYQTSF